MDAVRYDLPLAMLRGDRLLSGALSYVDGFCPRKGMAQVKRGKLAARKEGRNDALASRSAMGEQTSGGKGMSRLQGLLYRPMLKRACPGSGFGVMRS